MIRPKTLNEDLLLSITKICKTLIEQTHRKAEETLEFKTTNPSQTFHFNPVAEVKENWMIRLMSLEVYISIFNINKTNIKFKLYKYLDGVSFSYEKNRDEIERDLDISDITATDLQDDILGPITIKENWEQVTERMNDEKCMLILAMYVGSNFQDFESFLRTEVDLVEDDIKLVLDE